MPLLRIGQEVIVSVTNDRAQGLGIGTHTPTFRIVAKRPDVWAGSIRYYRRCNCYLLKITTHSWIGVMPASQLDRGDPAHFRQMNPTTNHRQGRPYVGLASLKLRRCPLNQLRKKVR